MRQLAEWAVLLMVTIGLFIAVGCAINVSWKVHPLAGVLAGAVIIGHIYIYVNERLKGRNGKR